MLNKLIFPLFAIAIAFAQPPGMGPGQRENRTPAFTNIKAHLNLSDTQIASILAGNKTAAEANRGVAEQMRTKQQALQTALDSGSTDATAIGRMMLEIQAFRKQLEANRTKAQTQALSFLSAEQKSKLKALEDAENLRKAVREAHALQLLVPSRDGEGPGPRFGGPGGPGMRGFGNFRR